MKVVVITGTSRGIGKALSEKFLNENYKVIGTSPSGDDTIVHKNFVPVPLEITSNISRETCVQKISEHTPSVDVLINNAGMLHEKDEGEEINIDALEQTFAVNLVGLVSFCENMIPLLRPQGEIVNISSRRGSLHDPHKDALFPAYSMSKAALNMYTQKLALRLNEKAIVSSVHPGSVKTDLNPDGEITPEEAASAIFTLVQKEKQTGNFWYKGEMFPW